MLTAGYHQIEELPAQSVDQIVQIGVEQGQKYKARVAN